MTGKQILERTEKILTQHQRGIITASEAEQKYVEVLQEAAEALWDIDDGPFPFSTLVD